MNIIANPNLGKGLPLNCGRALFWTALTAALLTFTVVVTCFVESALWLCLVLLTLSAALLIVTVFVWLKTLDKKANPKQEPEHKYDPHKLY